MCGRFTNRLTWREIVALYQLTVPANPERNLPARYNICPTQTIDTVIERDGKRNLVPMRWGLVPPWWKKTAKEAPSTFNARAETVAEKPMFRSAFKRNRCLIPASGYYEWQSTPTGKQPYTARDGSPLTIAGLWDEWKDIETGEPLESCITPTSLPPIYIIGCQSYYSRWISTLGWQEVGTELLKPAPNDYLQVWPVSRRVSSSRMPGYNPTLIDRVAA
jgi:putative SOS response-associated peptidase YedK